jgi:hypothetical protein
MNASNDRFGSWLCENSSARRAGRNISKKLRIMESNDAARAMFDTLLENCIFYISPMYEFLHSQGQIRSFRDVRLNVRLPEMGQGWAIYEYATWCGNLVVLPPGPKSPPAKCRDPSAAAQRPTAAALSNCSHHAATAVPRRSCWRTASRST